MKKIITFTFFALVFACLSSCLREEVPYNNGITYFNKGYYNHAITNFSEAIRIDPKFADAYVGRGNAYLYKKEYDAAMEDYNKALQLAPDNAGAYAGRGNAHRINGDIAQATADWEAALKIDPDNKEARKNMDQALGKN